MADNFFKVNQGVSYGGLSADPSDPQNGDTYYNTTTNKFRKYENGAWSDWSGNGGGLASVAPGSLITSNYTVQSSDNGRVLDVDTTSGPIDITLPSPATANFKVTIKDAKGTSGANAITIKRNGSELINNASSDDEIKENYRAVSLVSDGTNWSRTLSFSGVTPAVAGRALVAGGSASGTDQNVIDYMEIGTAANAVDFGDLTQARRHVGGLASATRGVFGGGQTGVIVGTIDYVTIATLGNALSFGSLNVSRGYAPGLSDATRGLFCGGIDSVARNEIDYITIATTGNALDFGDLTQARYFPGACASPTRGVIGGGITGTFVNTIDYVTIATTGNAASFGSLTVSRGEIMSGGCSNATRGLFGGGYNGSYQNVIDYVTIATIASALDFGDLITARSTIGAAASSTRALFAGGDTGGVSTAAVEYVTIATLGNGTNFGNLTVARHTAASCSNSHGGL